MSSFTRVLICGDRHLHNWPGMNRLIGKLVKRYGRGKLIIIHGGAPGIDRQARDVARKHSVHSCEVTALWQTLGRSAGAIRNRAMLALEPDIVIGIHHDLSRSLGTRDMLERARKGGVRKVIHIRPKGPDPYFGE